MIPKDSIMTTAFDESLVNLLLPYYKSYTLFIVRRFNDCIGVLIEDNQARISPSNQILKAKTWWEVDAV
jgi:hypothetical protein